MSAILPLRIRGRGDGAVVLLHTWPVATLEAMPAIARELRASGAELIRLDQLDRKDLRSIRAA